MTSILPRKIFSLAHHLNQIEFQEQHSIPSVEQTFAQIGKARYFSELDANSEFWQVELAPESAKLTTFITSEGSVLTGYPLG